MKNNQSSFLEINEVRVGYYFDYMDINEIDPANIKTFEPAQILNNIYSRLIEYDSSGNIQPGVCSSFYFDRNYLVFEFENKIQTRSGHYIDAEDAAISLKRLLKLKTGTHSSIELILNLKTIPDDIFKKWDEIFTVDNKLFIYSPNLLLRPYLITSFATGDLGIVPKSAIDIKSLLITNHLETSGPYYIDSITKNESLELWTLKNNPKHYNLSNFSPKVVKLIDKKKPSAYELMVNNEIDVIPSSISLDDNNLNSLKNVKDVIISKTLNIKLTYAQFSDKALEKFSREERSFLIKKFKMLYNHIPKRYESSTTSTFFQDQAFGQLTDKEIDTINNLNKQISKIENKKVKFSYYLYFKNKFGKFIHNDVPELELVDADGVNFDEKLVDLTVTDTDTAFEESLPLIHYNFKTGVFKSKITYDDWISEYINLNDDNLKSEKIHNLHMDTLSEGRIFPMFKSPYTTVSRNKFQFPLSPIFASSHFWKIRKIKE